MLCSWLGCIAGAVANTFSVYDVSTEEGHVKCTAPIRLNIARDCVPLTLEVVLDQLDGLYAPFLLTRSSVPLPAVEKACMHQLWKYSACRKALHSYDTFEAPVFQPRDHRYQLMDGPVVLWTEADKLHIQTSARHLALNLRTYSQLPPTWSLAVTAFWAFRHPRDDEMALVLVQTEAYSCLGAAATEQEWLCLEAKVNGLGAELVPADSFVPSDYGLVASCIALHRGHVMERTAGSIVARHIFVVGTSFKQVVVFQDGQPLYVFPVQLVPTLVTVSEVMGGGMAVITLDEGHNVYLHMTKSNNRIERCMMWSEASNILIGDFTACGHNQLLVLSEMREGKSDLDLESCQLHDLSNPSSSSEMQQRMVDVPMKVSTSSLVEALRALDLRRKIGDLYLCDLEKEFENKTELMEQGWRFLRSLQTGSNLLHNTPPPDPTLVTLLPGKSATEEGQGTVVRGFPVERAASSPSPPPCAITLTSQWQRIVDQQWVVGIVVQSHKPLPNVSVALVRRSGRSGVDPHQVCSSKVVWLEEGKLGIAAVPKAKRPRTDTPDGETKCGVWRMCVVTVCREVPLLERGESLASIVCSWNGRGDVGSVVLGTVTLCIDDLVTGALACDERCLWLWQGNHHLTMQQGDFSDKHVQDLACMLSAGAIEKVTFTSTHTPLSCLPGMLRARLPSNVPVLPAAGRGDDLTLLPNPTCGGGVGGLEGVVLYATVKPNATLSILHKTTPQLSLVMSLLRHVLPEDVIMISFCEDEAHLISTVLGCLEDELLTRGDQGPDQGTTLVECCTKTDHAISGILLQDHTNMM